MFKFVLLVFVLTATALSHAQPSLGSIPRNIRPFDPASHRAHPLEAWIGNVKNNRPCSGIPKITVPQHLKPIVSKATRTCQERKDSNASSHGGERTISVTASISGIYLFNSPVLSMATESTYSLVGDEVFFGATTFLILGNAASIRKRALSAWTKLNTGEIGKEQDGMIYIDFEAIRHALVCDGGTPSLCKYSIGYSI